MAAKTEQSKQEAETVIRWDETEGPATLWTASVAVRNEWRACGFKVEIVGGGWGCDTPIDRIIFKSAKKPSKIEVKADLLR